jgi:peptidoglycan/LPS O-acetylase OafA/YrhL
MSWKTTVCGILGILVVGINVVAIPLLDNNLATVPQWDVFVAALAGGLGLIFARDHGVSSEEAGIK